MTLPYGTAAVNDFFSFQWLYLCCCQEAPFIIISPYLSSLMANIWKYRLLWRRGRNILTTWLLVTLFHQWTRFFILTLCKKTQTNQPLNKPPKTTSTKPKPSWRYFCRIPWGLGLLIQFTTFLACHTSSFFPRPSFQFSTHLPLVTFL